jgi:hypothetical protein
MVFSPIPKLPIQFALHLITANSLFDLLLLPVSIGFSWLHIRGAKKLTDTGAFHIFHSMYCLTACLNEGNGRFFLNVSYSCNDLILAIRLFIVQQLFFNVACAIFFNHWQRALLGTNKYRLPRYLLYACNFIYEMLSYIIGLSNLRGNDDDEILDRTCQFKTLNMLVRGVLCLAVILVAECLILAVLSQRSLKSTPPEPSVSFSSPLPFPLNDDAGIEMRNTNIAEFEEYPSEMEAGADRWLSAEADSPAPTQSQGQGKDIPSVGQRQCSCNRMNLKAAQPFVFGTLFVTAAFGTFLLFCTTIFEYKPRLIFVYYYIWKPLSVLPIALMQVIYMSRFRHLSLDPDQGWIESRASGRELEGHSLGYDDSWMEQTKDKNAEMQQGRASGRESIAIFCLAGDADGDEVRREHEDDDREDEEVEGEEEEEEKESISEYLVSTPPLVSDIQVQFSYGFDGAVQVKEDLRPPFLQHRVASQFARNVACPALDLAIKLARADLSALLKSCGSQQHGGQLRGGKSRSSSEDPGNSNINGMCLETQRLYGLKVKEARSLLRQYESVGRIFRAVAAHQGDAPSSSSSSYNTSFKPSTAKSISLVSPLSTNLQVHKVAITNPGTKHFSKQATMVTFGAPAAHVLGFKSGGLRSIAAKLKALREKKGQFPTSPDGVLQFLQLKYLHTARALLVVSQALGAVVAAAAEALAECVQTRNAPLLMRWHADCAGLLVHSVGLLTTAGKEAGMLCDFAGALEMLQVVVRLEPLPAGSGSGHDTTTKTTEEEWNGGPVDVKFLNLESSANKELQSAAFNNNIESCGNVTVALQLEPPGAHAWAVATLAQVSNSSSSQTTAAAAAAAEIKVVPVLFNLGVNEMQTVANAKKATAIQTEINQRACRDLSVYHTRCIELAKGRGRGEEAALSPVLPRLFRELQELVDGEAVNRAKDVNLLLVSCHVAQLLKAARTTSCKSAKDRTSVFLTLEVSDQAARAKLLDDDDVKSDSSSSSREGASSSAAAAAAAPSTKDDEAAFVVKERVVELAAALRGPSGVRLKNCELNVGQSKYAFNALQVQALPQVLRPPTGTFGASQS